MPSSFTRRKCRQGEHSKPRCGVGAFFDQRSSHTRSLGPPADRSVGEKRGRDRKLPVVTAARAAAAAEVAAGHRTVAAQREQEAAGRASRARRREQAGSGGVDSNSPGGGSISSQGWSDWRSNSPPWHTYLLLTSQVQSSPRAGLIEKLSDDCRLRRTIKGLQATVPRPRTTQIFPYSVNLHWHEIFVSYFECKVYL